jgi:hypothetical protein
MGFHRYFLEIKKPWIIPGLILKPKPELLQNEFLINGH